MLDGTDRRPLAPVAGRVWEGKLRSIAATGVTGTSGPRPAGLCMQADPDLKGQDPALGRSRGGFSTQIHILADQWGRSLCLRLTGGSATTAPSPGLG